MGAKAVILTVAGVAVLASATHPGAPEPAVSVSHRGYEPWARAFLDKGHWPVNGCTLGGVIAWEHTEGSPREWHNPLDSTAPMPGSHEINGDHVQSYPQPWEGLRAPVRSVTVYYPAIRAALSAGASAQAIADATQQPDIHGYRWGTRPFTAYCLPGR